jgi:hypothetical protein
MTDHKWVVFEDAGQYEGYTPFPKFVQYNTSLTRHARFLYSLFLSFAWDDDEIFPGQDRLMELMGCKDEQLRKYMIELRDAELISWVRRGQGKTNLYTIRRFPEPPKPGSLEPPKQGTKEKASKKTQSKNTSSRGGEPPQEQAQEDVDQAKKTSAFDYMKLYADQLDAALPLADRERGRTASQIQKAVDGHVDDKMIRRALSRMVARRDEGVRLEFNDALGDVRTGGLDKQPRSSNGREQAAVPKSRDIREIWAEREAAREDAQEGQR